MENEWIQLAVRLVKFFTMAVAAVLLVWRGNRYSDGPGAGMLAPVMCVVTAVCLVFTGLAMTVKEEGE